MIGRRYGDETLEFKGFKANRTKREKIDGEVRIDTEVIPKRGSFKYLESLNPSNREIDENVVHRIGAEQMK